ncbi:hypothetical protein BCR32DRAFT_290933 [Anaeromyces robustus]|uniref:Uncharacterized protein n=1 Tax=Anaeromyces robustus TaxID=1754192 RepID=A0A1Y1XH55_9FUNG|nr:hypothetical protein BCR32DRAFT_290933 [Anaeromyces robustus]|eukprot:ORX85077.1 hypothetical protein BCR32DRAFT_290933 [Anaeromyces robustus]
MQGLSAAESEAFHQRYFIENGRSASFGQWMISKGTNFTCFTEHYNSFNKEDLLENEFDFWRTILYAIHRPFKFTFFYWTILVFILHKFNFKKPVMKLILAHFILRSTGDVLDTVGELYSHYYVTVVSRDKNGAITGFGCMDNGEMNPMRWFLSRQIGTVFWYVGEMFADWYPLLRTKAVVKDNKSLIYVYIACGFFNLCKLALIILHWTLDPTKLYGYGKFATYGEYDKGKVMDFYFIYWTNQLIIIISSFLYDITVFFVLKKNLFQSSQTEIGFLKKFKTISEYRIFISSVVGIIFLPLLIIIIIIKYIYKWKYGYVNLNFSFDEVRQTIANVQYYMIFIDQIFLLYCNNNSVNNNSTDIYSFNNLSSNNTILSSKYPYNHLSNNSAVASINRNSTMTSNNRNSFLEFSYLKANPNNNIFNSKNFIINGSTNTNTNTNNNDNNNNVNNNDEDINHGNNNNNNEKHNKEEKEINNENKHGSINPSPISPMYRNSINYNNRNSMSYNNRSSMSFNRNSLNRNSINRNLMNYNNDQINNLNTNKFY